MSAISDYLENALITHIFRNTDFTRPANIYLALFTVAPSDAGGGTEVSGGSYAREPVPTGASSAWDAASGGATQNTGVETFPTATADWGEVVAMALFDAVTVGNMLFWGFLSTLYWVFSADTADVLTAPGHSLVNTDKVVVKTLGNSSLPTGLTADTIYFVRDVSGATFKLAATVGGAAIDLTAVGGGTIHKLSTKTVLNGDIFRFNAGDVDVALL